MLRFIMRLLLLLMTLVGIGIAFVMPWAAERQDAEAGRWRVYDRSAGFRDVTATIAEKQPPAMVIEIHTEGPLPSSLRGALLTVTASVAERTVLAEAVDIAGVVGRVVTPQSGEHVYSRTVATLPADAAGPMLFHFTPGDADTNQLLAIDMVLKAAAFQADPRLLPLGYVLLVVGFVGLVTSFRSRQSTARTEPAPPKWGRG